LDEYSAERVCMLEGPGRFAVRYELPGDDQLHWSWIANERPDADRSALRRKQRLLRKRTASPAGRYEDLFRALGYELEQEDASGILINCQTQNLTVSFTHLDPGHSFMRMKQMVSLGPAEQDELRQTARIRRLRTGNILSRWNDQHGSNAHDTRGGAPVASRR
jgi:hypothetical protein